MRTQLWKIKGTVKRRSQVRSRQRASGGFAPQCTWCVIGYTESGFHRQLGALPGHLQEGHWRRCAACWVRLAGYRTQYNFTEPVCLSRESRLPRCF